MVLGTLLFARWRYSVVLRSIFGPSDCKFWSTLPKCIGVMRVLGMILVALPIYSKSLMATALFPVIQKADKAKSFPSHTGPLGGANIRFTSPQPGTSLHCEITDTWLLHRTVCLFAPQLSVVLITPAYRGLARLSWPGRLVILRDGLPDPKTVTHPGTNRARRSSTTLIETNALPLSQTCWHRNEQKNQTN